MTQFDIRMQHSEESLYALAHMQYDLFCTRNFIAKNLLSLCLVILGAYFFSHFWGILLLAYGCYLLTSTYSSSNYQVRKLLGQLKAAGQPLPSSQYRFEDGHIAITYHPGKPDEEELTPVSYSALLKLGEDSKYFYLFPSSHGGYCIPKDALGERKKEFVAFLEDKTGQRFYHRRPSPLRRLRDWLKKRASEPEHL